MRLQMNKNLETTLLVLFNAHPHKNPIKAQDLISIHIQRIVLSHCEAAMRQQIIA
jgi:hypothetical protein